MPFTSYPFYPIIVDSKYYRLRPGDSVLLQGPLPELYPRVWQVEHDEEANQLLLIGFRTHLQQLTLTNELAACVTKISQTELLGLPDYDAIVAAFELADMDIWLEEVASTQALRLRGMSRQAHLAFHADLTPKLQQELHDQHKNAELALLCWMKQVLGVVTGTATLGARELQLVWATPTVAKLPTIMAADLAPVANTPPSNNAKPIRWNDLFLPATE